MNVAVNGFFLQAADRNGLCLTQMSNLNNFKTERLDFNKFITMSCSIVLGDVAAFQAYCESGNAINTKLFSQMSSSFKNIGIFGNADPNNSKDWVPVIDQTTADGFFKGVFDKNQNSCTLYASVQAEIVTSVTGFEGKLQNYILGAEVSGVAKTTWFFPAAAIATKTPQNFTHFLSISFRQVLPSDYNLSVDSAINKATGDLFYPLNIETGKKSH